MSKIGWKIFDFGIECPLNNFFVKLRFLIETFTKFIKFLSLFLK